MGIGQKDEKGIPTCMQLRPKGDPQLLWINHPAKKTMNYELEKENLVLTLQFSSNPPWQVSIYYRYQSVVNQLAIFFFPIPQLLRKFCLLLHYLPPIPLIQICQFTLVPILCVASMWTKNKTRNFRFGNLVKHWVPWAKITVFTFVALFAFFCLFALPLFTLSLTSILYLFPQLICLPLPFLPHLYLYFLEVCRKVDRSS